MNITIPDVPPALNPKGWEVEVSSYSERKEGKWQFFWSTDAYGWEKYLAEVYDDVLHIHARLIEPKYLFNGEMKTISECRKILERDYEIVADVRRDDCVTCPLQKGWHTCVPESSPLRCSGGTWRKKQPAKDCSECAGNRNPDKCEPTCSPCQESGKLMDTPHDEPPEEVPASLPKGLLIS
jgi:hypothetical protein